MTQNNLVGKAFDILGKIELFVAALSLTALLGVTFVGVLMRYFLGKPFVWLEEFQLAAILWTVFPAGCIAFRMKGHVAIEVFVEMLPKKLQIIFEVFIGLVIVFALVFLFRAMQAYIGVFIRSGRATPILKIPYTVVYGIGPVCSILMIVEYFVSILMPVKDGEEALQ